jgi:hypothetical protein
MYFGLWPGQWPGDWQGRANGAEITAQLAATETPDVVAIQLGDIPAPEAAQPARWTRRATRSIRRLPIVREIELRALEAADVVTVLVTLGEIPRDDHELEALFLLAA